MDRHELDKGSKTPRDGINQLMLLQVGRPVIYGLAAKGERGVRQVIEMLKDEFELTMALCGCPGVMDITRSHNSSNGICQNLAILVGGFETKTGEQWLAFRNHGKSSAADYAKVMSEKVSRNRAAGVWNKFEQEETIKRRRYFVTKLLQGIMRGLAYMHDHDRLHQSLGPASVILNTITERDAAYLVPRLRDLAFSVDIGYSNLEGGPGLLSEGLWRRASTAGAFTPMEKRAFGISDDIYEAGLLLAYLAFVPFCEAGIMDGLSLQVLIFFPLTPFGRYCLADDRLLDAVKFLDLGDGAGWELLQRKKRLNGSENESGDEIEIEDERGGW
ncbi:unnamed protein product [Prunus armeniaca]|uniref:Protein kinase domain-containing protein n=1 Tax=Prunus armeniaca TaxID=36596 RepID=A0A6J5TCS3_PRUAR|nr:unnamed protein product [Prunus armeniaca]